MSDDDAARCLRVLDSLEAAVQLFEWILRQRAFVSRPHAVGIDHLRSWVFPSAVDTFLRNTSAHSCSLVAANLETTEVAEPRQQFFHPVVAVVYHILPGCAPVPLAGMDLHIGSWRRDG